MKVFFACMFFISSMSSAYAASQRFIVCENTLGAKLVVQQHTIPDPNPTIGTLTYNYVVSNSLMDQGIANAYNVALVGKVNWENLTFAESSPYGESGYLRTEEDGKMRFVLISQQYKKTGDYLFQANECKQVSP